MTENTQRLRATYAKGEAVKYISHLDLARTMERAFRRARLPLVYSQGFNPRPKFAFASALPVGATGRAELLDIWLSPPLSLMEFAKRLAPQLPEGIELVEAREVDPHLPALQASVSHAEYVVTLEAAPPDLEKRLAALLDSDTLPMERQRKGELRAYDLRPLILELWRVLGGHLPGAEAQIGMKLANSSSATGRADQVLAALGLESAARAVERTRLYFDLPDR